MKGPNNGRQENQQAGRKCGVEGFEGRPYRCGVKDGGRLRLVAERDEETDEEKVVVDFRPRRWLKERQTTRCSGRPGSLENEPGRFRNCLGMGHDVS